MQRLPSYFSMNQKTALVARPAVAVIGYSVLKLVDQIGVDGNGEAFNAQRLDRCFQFQALS